MKRSIILSAMLASSLFAIELQWGHGTMELEGGFLGLSETISDDIDTYSLVQSHKNFSDSKYFYSFTFTIFDSKKMKDIQKTYNTGVKQANSVISAISKGDSYITIPQMEYRLEGLDVGISLGYDLVHNSDKDYLGVGAYTGVSAPIIKSNKSLSRTISANAELAKSYLDSDTEILSYKIGLGVYGEKSLSSIASIYGSAIYSYQTLNIKNDYAKADFDLNGKYLELNAGVKLEANNSSKFSGLYGTLGWRYREWQVDDAAINISGIGSIKTPESDMKFSSNALSVGLGYSF
jgi:hypothetical protein